MQAPEQIASATSSRLVQIRIEIEEHWSALWNLETERDELLAKLRALGAAPRVPPGSLDAA